MNETFQFTRYLYEKEEVKIALIVAILNKKEDEALFWAYELFYSGFTKELTQFIWQIYYDFYATLNPSFETYLLVKLKSELTSETSKTVGIIINNVIIRPHTIDVFILRQIVNQYEFGIIDNNEIINLLKTEDYLMIAYLIINTFEETKISTIYSSMITYFNNMGLNINNKELNSYKKVINTTTNFATKQIILLSRIIHYYTLMKKKNLGKKLFVHMEPNEIIMYETIETNLKKQENDYRFPVLPARKILPIATIYNIDKNNYLSLFHSKREKYDIVDAYRYNWEYYASFSPLWRERIYKYGGTIENDSKKVVFLDDDLLEEFYQEYGFEPDEQKIEIQEKSIKQIKRERTCLSFYNEHNKNGIVEIEEDYFKEMHKFM